VLSLLLLALVRCVSVRATMCAALARVAPRAARRGAGAWFRGTARREEEDGREEGAPGGGVAPAVRAQLLAPRWLQQQGLLQLQQQALVAPHVRALHASARRESMTPVIVGGGIAVIALAGSKLIEAIDRRAAAKAAAAEGATGEGKAADAAADDAGAGFLSWFSFGKRYYEGGFEPEMTRREAALILGIRESAPRDKVREAHRRLAMLNHPDMGGSTYIASKINEAKDKLSGNT
jgi:DnaJ family protein C protein 19